MASLSGHIENDEGYSLPILIHKHSHAAQTSLAPIERFKETQIQTDQHLICCGNNGPENSALSPCANSCQADARGHNQTRRAAKQVLLLMPTHNQAQLPTII